jgi:hypothetical protein
MLSTPRMASILATLPPGVMANRRADPRSAARLQAVMSERTPAESACR